MVEMAQMKADRGDEKGAMQLTFESAVVKVAVVETPPPPKVAGLYSRKVPVVTVSDAAAVPREYCEPSESRLLAAWRASGHSDKFQVPGVTFRMDSTPVTR